jgi:hypothetical protein
MNLKLGEPTQIFLVGALPLLAYLTWFNVQGYGLDRASTIPNSMDKYAISLLDSLNPISVKIKHEIGGRIILRHGKIMTDGIILGGKAFTLLPMFLQTPMTGKGLAHFHTHGDDDPMYDSEEFSHEDTLDSKEIQYLETPHGLIWKHIPKGSCLMQYNRNTGHWMVMKGCR